MGTLWVWALALTAILLSFGHVYTEITQTFIVRVRNDLKPSQFLDVEEWYSTTLRSLTSYKSMTLKSESGKGEKQRDFVHVYKTVFNGFAARLTNQQVEELSNLPQVLGIIGFPFGASACLPGSLDKKLVRGKIVVCDRGGSPRAAKGLAVKEAGGVGVIIENVDGEGEGLSADPHLIPGLAITESGGKPHKPWDINYPAISVVFDMSSRPSKYNIAVMRTATHVGNGSSSYSVVVTPPRGAKVTVDPPKMTFTEKGQKKSYVVRIQMQSVPPVNLYAESGKLTWTDGKHQVTSPLMVVWKDLPT
ncbi:hypothetical protein Acr_28g0000800 [Actinidia rufa]|uniref:Subtilase family protein n=1 Tax=Actinidia rufa TaxID=165716 RepID=A0A7J0H8T7_9ERIC|nr:hypothetical protein Acr_28g0000800 [Actinidia rufa]